VTRWLIIAGLWPMAAAAAANAQSVLQNSQPTHRSRTINLRLTQDPTFNQFETPATGFIADTEVAPNARLGLKMVHRSRPRFGPDVRIDGVQSRSRRPAFSFTFRF
jgi:hypothetical protein